MLPPNHPSDDIIGTALLQAVDPSQRREAGELLAMLGYTVVEPGSGGALPDIVVLIAKSASLPAVPSLAVEGEYPPPLVVFGPGGKGEWRKQALENGAFACISMEAPLEERASMIAAASRYREAQKEIQIIRRESDVIVTGLLQTYGEEAQKLNLAIEERRESQEALDRIQKRIIRSIL